MLFLLGLACFAEAEARDYLRMTLDDSGELTVSADMNLAQKTIKASEISGGMILVFSEDGNLVLTGKMGTLKKTEKEELEEVVDVKIPPFPETPQGKQAMQLFKELQEMRFKEQAYRDYKKFFSESERALIKSGGLLNQLERNGYRGGLMPMLNDTLFEKVNPIPTSKVLQARVTWETLKQIGYDGPREEIEQLLTELEAIIQKPA